MATSDNYVFDLDNQAKVPNQPKSIYAGDVYGDQACITVLDNGIFISASKTNVLNITEEFGIHLTGNISFSANPNQIAIGGGYWTLNPLLLSCMPSTSATPIPVLIQATPKILKASKGFSNSLSTLSSNGL